MKISAVLAGLALSSAWVSAANAGILFGPSQGSYSSTLGGTVNIPFTVTLTGGTTTADLSYVGFNFITSGDTALVSNYSWSFEPALGGTVGPVTYSRFFSSPVALGTTATLLGTLTVNLSNVGPGTTVFLTPGQGSGPQWLWQGTNCPTNPDMGTVSITVPGPGAAGLFGIAGLLVARRRRSGV